MNRQVELWLTRIDYEGENVGRTFAFKIKGGLSSISFSKQIQHDSSAVCQRLVYSKILLSETYVALKIEIREKDVIQDLGSAEVSFFLNSGISEDYHSLPVEVIESGSNNTGAKARIILTFLEKCYNLGDSTLVKTGEDGWIKGVQSSGSKITLPYGLRVSVIKVEKRREFFKILEGHEIGHNASLSFETGNDRSRFTLKQIHNPPCYIKYSKTKDIVKIKGIGPVIKIKMDHSDVLPDGVYDVEIPDVPHAYGIPYLAYSVFAQTWFRVVYPSHPQKGYYFHFGRVSRGCITVLADENPDGIWDKVYKFLILCRDPAKKGIIGKIEVLSENREIR